MARYAAYGVLYHKGRKVTRPYRLSVGKTAKEAKRKAKTYNTQWNKIKANRRQGWVGKFTHTRRVKR